MTAGKNSLIAPWSMHGVRGILSNPVYLAEAGVGLATAQLLASTNERAGAKCLDVGCGTSPYHGLLPSVEWVGVDVPHSGRPAHLKAPHLFYDGVRLPFADGTMAGVLCTQVLEHAKSVEPLIEEMFRVLRPGGWCMISVPMAWEEHEIPDDFRRFTAFGLVRILTSNGFEPDRVIRVGGSYETLAQLAANAAYSNYASAFRRGGRVLTALVCAPLQIAGMLLQRVLPDAGTLYLNVAILARKAQ